MTILWGVQNEMAKFFAVTWITFYNIHVTLIVLDDMKFQKKSEKAKVKSEPIETFIFYFGSVII